MAIDLLQDFFQTIVSTKWNSTGAGNFYISTLPTPTNGYLIINRASTTKREIVKYTGTGTDGGGNYVTIASSGDRGLGGTTAQTHEIDETVQMNFTAEHWEDLDTALDSIVAGGAVDASTSQKGITKLSVTPASASNPIAVGDNDPRVPDSDTSDALAGTSGTPSSSNKFVTDDDVATVSTADKIPRADASGKLDPDFIPDNISRFFTQEIPVNKTITTSLGTDFGLCGNTDGSVIFLASNTENDLIRYEKDSNTGAFLRTHIVAASFSLPDNFGMVVIGDYLYVLANNGTNITAKRFLAADLTGGTSMTVPTVSCTSGLIAWTDGTDVYVISGESSTTSRRWTVSGTTFSAASTETVSGIYDSKGQTMWDGTNAFVISPAGEDCSIVKLTTIDGTTKDSAVEKNIGYYSDSDTNQRYIININENTCYIGKTYAFYDEAAQIGIKTVLIPITKP